MSRSIKSESDILYLVLTGLFVTSLVTCNLIFQKFFQLEIWLPFIGHYTFEQSVGLLPYPITFLVTDIISEIYGRKKANRVVIVGLIASLFMLLIVSVANVVNATIWSPVSQDMFQQVFGLSFVAVFSSMMAYLFAQYVDIRLFHFWKRLTNGRHLWLRNNASTIFSQFIDTFTVLFLLCSLDAIQWELFSKLLINGFLFKVFFAAFDTPLFYVSAWYLKRRFKLIGNTDLSDS